MRIASTPADATKSASRQLGAFVAEFQGGDKLSIKHSVANLTVPKV